MAATARQDEEEAEAHLRVQYAAIAVCVAISLLSAVVVYMLGPLTLLQSALQLLPEDPSSAWSVAWGLVLTVATVIMLPLWHALCVASGLMFNLALGTAVNFCGLMVGNVLSMILGRTLLQEPVRAWLEETNRPILRRAFLIMEDSEDSFRLLVMFRFLLIPIGLRNYGCATLKVDLWKLVVASVPHTLWIALACASLGASLKDVGELVREEEEEVPAHSRHWQHFAMFGVALVFMLCFSLYAYKVFQDHAQEESKPLAAEKRDRETDEERTP
eukprot:TRINITY_DN32137_c0_g1_i2.p1 TRINITY_DN32137_c0_g1~~TRINITY_DN32137_c0_g1_i2.p1  ORF type:complete len:273 (+),score=42.56 TRINITY_DN32137_c0_g1_i2:125-943(+)